MKPNPPTNFTVTMRRIYPLLRWDRQPGVTGYEISRFIAGDRGPTLRAGFTSRVTLGPDTIEWYDSQYDELAPSCRFYGGRITYRIRALNGNLRSYWSEAEITTYSPALIQTTMPDVTAYVCSPKSGAVSKLALQGDGAARLIASKPVTGAAASAVYGPYLVVADYSDMQIGTLTVLDRHTLATVGSVTDPRLAYATGIEILGTSAVVASQTYMGPGTLTTVDLINPAQPQVVGSTPVNQTYLSHPFGIQRWGDYVFVAGNSNQRLCVVDVRNPAASVYVAAHQTFGIGEGHTALAMSYPYLFCSHDCGSIVTYDISNPLDPRAIGQIGDKSTLFGVYGMQLALGILHCVNETGVYSQVNVSDPTAPTLGGSVNLGKPLWAVRLAGDHAWTAGEGGIQAVHTASLRVRPALSAAEVLGATSITF